MNASEAAAASPLHLLPAPPIIPSPCAACKFLRRRCADNCLLAPFFPPANPLKFAVAHRIFGASNIVKILCDLPEIHRADAVSSMVYEANARIRDPIYGSTGAICKLQKQVTELEAQFARARADLLYMQTQYANLLALIMGPTSTEATPAGLQAEAVPSSCYDTGGAENSSIWDGSIPCECYDGEDFSMLGGIWQSQS